MLHDRELREFLEKEININNDRLKKAKSKVNSIDWSLVKFLMNNIWDELKDTLYQWSFSYHTIIKPNKDDDSWEYDVDLAVRLKYNSDYEGSEYKYHNLLIDCFEKSDSYKDKLDKTKERAVRIQYDENDWEFHVDLVPMFHDWKNWKVVNRKKNETEISWWAEFRDWVNGQNNKTSSDKNTSKYLKEVIRIFKFLRNNIDSDLIRSVQLTLLLSRQIDKLDSDDFSSLSESFYLIAKKLKEELDLVNSVSDLDLKNPWLEEEVFERNFDNDQFIEFKDWIIDLFEKLNDAYNEDDKDKSIEKWQKIFWDNFAISSINKSLVIHDYNHKQSIESYWLKRLDNKKIKLKIVAQKVSLHNWLWKPFYSWELVPKMYYNFYVRLPVDISSNRLLWQVTNENNQFVKSTRWEMWNESMNLWFVSKRKWYWIREYWSWKWRHLVKCYLINVNNVVIWESDEFIVRIW